MPRRHPQSGPAHPVVRRLVAAATTLTAAAALLAGCSSDDEESAGPAASAPSSPAERSATASPSPAADPSPTGSAAGDPAAGAGADPLPPVRRALSLPALMRDDVQGGPIRRTRPLAETERWRSWAVTYTADGATVSGELLVPKGRGPFPGVVLNHGYIEPSVYQLGQGLSREQEWLASNGFAVLHTDYRGHAGSDPASPIAREARLVYARDAIAAVKALQREPQVDAERMAMLGRSMGGGVTYGALVAAPGLVDAAVVFAPVSSWAPDNLRQFSDPGETTALVARFGTPREAPQVWRELSPRTYLDRVTEPVLVLHGTADDTCPPQWSRDTVRAMRRAGVDVELQLYEGEGHAFGPRYEDSMRRTVGFLRDRLRG
ncbi:alpha/beta fold hydrolase [Nocardioides perillae]|uniref:Dienelactone hydrolase n=1 Tax=Nocardioides perillae TaxID=1119534 RepID=A0A7Y9UV17_9ACTN|nr:dienelactone hydrolase [Nocardioides perillae]